MNDFGSQVRQQRVAKELSQEELAERVGISRNYLSQIERGVSTNLSLEVARKLSEELGLLLEEPQLQNIPDSLRQLAEEEGLGPRDVQTLAGIEYRGRRPQTVEEWRLLHLAIKAATGSRR